MADRQAELNVCLNHPGVGSAVEKPELQCAFGEGGVEVPSMVTGGIIMLIPVAVGVFCIPKILKLCHRLRLFLINSFNQLLIHFFAVRKSPWVNLQGFVENILFAGNDVYHISQYLLGVPAGIHMNVNPAFLAGKCPFVTELPDNFLQMLFITN